MCQKLEWTGLHRCNVRGARAADRKAYALLDGTEFLICTKSSNNTGSSCIQSIASRVLRCDAFLIPFHTFASFWLFSCCLLDYS